MRRIGFRALNLSCFKSFVEPTEIRLSRQPGLKFLGGQNLLEPRLGSNGAGKSSVWDGLFWVLFGVGVRGQRAADLVSYGKQRPSGTIDLDVDGVSHIIERHGSPNRLLLNKTMATQDDIDRLLGMGRDRFLQSVLFGQGSDLFLDLSAAARGELLDAVLGLGLWMEAADAASAQSGLLGREKVKQDEELAFARGKLAGTEDIDNLKRLSGTWKTVRTERLDFLLNELEQQEGLCQQLQQQLRKTTEELEAQPSTDEYDTEIQRLRDLLRDIASIDDQMKFYQENSFCPTCTHPLSKRFIETKAKELVKELDSLLDGRPDVARFKLDLEDIRQERDEISRRREVLQKALSDSRANLQANKHVVDRLIEQIEQLGNEENPYADQLDKLQENREKAEAAIAATEQRQQQIAAELMTVDFWKQGFRRVRLFRVQQICSRMDIEVANVAKQLGLHNWQIKFVTEVETKSGSVKPGINVVVSTPHYRGKWEHYSGGESQRVRLAVTLGIAQMIQSLAGVSYEIEVLDEASQYLSVEGVEDLLIALGNRADAVNRSIWVTDHSLLSTAAFVERWTVTKDERGSRISQS